MTGEKLTICSVTKCDAGHEHHSRPYMPSIIIHTGELKHGCRSAEIWIYHAGMREEQNSYLAGTLLLRDGDVERLFPTAIKHGALREES